MNTSQKSPPRLIDKFMPEWEWREQHTVPISASPPSVYDAILKTDVRSSWIIRTLIKLRGLPGHSRRIPEVTEMGFIHLGDEPNREIVFGMVGRFWTKSGDLVQTPPDQFARFNASGYTKLAWNFYLDKLEPKSTLLSTETRVISTSPEARRRFQIYWLIIRPFSGLIRIIMLSKIRRCAERRSMPV
jgi:hypothetical protein